MTTNEITSTAIQNLPLIYFDVSLHGKSPTRKNKDKENKILAETGAEKGVIRVQQEVVPERWQKPLTSVQTKIRAYFDNYAFRLNSGYAIPVKLYDSFVRDLKPLLDKHEVCVNALCNAVESGAIVEEAERRSNGEFNRDVLPQTCGEVRAAYQVSIRHRADLGSKVIMQALSELAEETRTKVETLVREGLEQAEAEGQRSMVGFIMDEVVAFLKDVEGRCSEGGQRQWKTLLDKFTRITEKLPAYNITNNPEVSSAIERVFQTFKNLDAANLKADEAYRKKTAENAREVLENLPKIF